MQNKCLKTLQIYFLKSAFLNVWMWFESQFIIDKYFIEKN